MKKSLPFLFLLIFFSSFSSVNAQSSFFENLKESFYSFFTGKTSLYISKDPSVDLNKDNSQFTTYNVNNSYDYTNRTISDSSRLVNRGQHIEDIILNKYSSPSETINERDDKILALVCEGQCQNTTYVGNNCRPLRISEVAYFYLTKGTSTSYKLENNRAISIPFSDEIKSKLISTYQETNLAPEACYSNILNQISITPKSNDADQSPKNTTSSDQLTNVEKTLLPDKDGSKEVPLTWYEFVANAFDGGNTAKVKENYYRENQYLQSFAPEKQKNSLNIDVENDNDSLRSNFSSLLKPDKWAEGIYDSGEGSATYDNGTYNNVDLSTYINGIEFYIFENPGGRRMTTNYDLLIKDPSKLVTAPTSLQAPGYNEKVDSRIIPAYLAMIQAAHASGIADSQLRLVSGYRSYAQQLALWNKYPANERCDGINKPCYVARPGSSNHMTGRAIDIVVTGAGKAKTMTPAYRWLLDNANKFGFYNYDPEPWHWEYNPKTP